MKQNSKNAINNHNWIAKLAEKQHNENYLEFQNVGKQTVKPIIQNKRIWGQSKFQAMNDNLNRKQQKLQLKKKSKKPLNILRSPLLETQKRSESNGEHCKILAGYF